MIIVVSPADKRIVKTAKEQSYNFPDIYGSTFIIGENEIPELDHNEDLFIIGHGIKEGDSGVAEIGNADGAYAFDALELWDSLIKQVLPDMYSGNIYVDACSSADWAWDNFSFIETLQTQVDVADSVDARVFGRVGEVGGGIPAPTDPNSWTEAPRTGVLTNKPNLRRYLMSDEMINPSGPWDSGRDAFALGGELQGRNNLARWRSAIDTENQRLSGMINMTGYKLMSEATKHDFYCVFGSFSHGVSHQKEYHPGKNLVSVGYYATEMSLNLELHDSDAMVWDSGPTSTVGANQTSFSIGGNLSGGTFAGEPIIQGGVSGSFGAGFSSPNVKFAQTMMQDHVQWVVKLPGVSFVSPGVPSNPEEPSYAGYKWYFGAIFVIPSGRTFALDVVANVSWNFDYTRGITNDRKILAAHDTYFYRGGSNT